MRKSRSISCSILAKKKCFDGAEMRTSNSPSRPLKRGLGAALHMKASERRRGEEEERREERRGEERMVQGDKKRREEGEKTKTNEMTGEQRRGVERKVRRETKLRDNVKRTYAMPVPGNPCCSAA